MTEKQSARNIRLAEALESGEYKQGNSKLRDGDLLCCLGVACDLFDPSRWDQHYGSYEGEQSYVPSEVQEYYGWCSRNPRIKVLGEIANADSHNDVRGRSFPEIAQGFRLLAAEMDNA